MHSNSQSQLQSQDTQKSSLTIQMLQKIIEKERKTHLREIKAINQSIEDYVSEKKQECRQYEMEITRLNSKIVQGKQKYIKLAEKNKEQSDNIKQLMQKKISLENQIIKNRSQIGKERQKNYEQSRYISELKHVIELQQIQNGELKKECEKLAKEIVYLQGQVQNYVEVRDKFANIDSIAQQQYQTEINLLREQLAHQFTTKTQDIFQEMTHKQYLDCSERENACEQIVDINLKTIKKEFANKHTQLCSDELHLLASYVDYGEMYFQVDNAELQVNQSQKIFVFIAELVRSKNLILAELTTQKQLNDELRGECEQRVESMEGELAELRFKSVVNQEVQTIGNFRVDEVININTNLKLKLYQMQKIISLMSHFSVYLFQLHSIQIQKHSYYAFAERRLYRSVRPVPAHKKFKIAALTVVFIEMIKKQSRKKKRLLKERKVLNIQKHTKNNSLAHIFQLFFMKRECTIVSSNHKIEEVIKDKVGGADQKFLAILNQQHLNQANFCDYTPPSIHRFMMQIQNRSQWRQNNLKNRFNQIAQY